MGLQWSSKLIKYFLFIFNLLFVITGIVVISVGITVKAKFNDYVTFLDDSYLSIPNLLIATGSIIFFIAFFGCCGAIKENFCMTITFSSLLILIFILEFSAGIAGYVLKNNTIEFLDNKLTESIEKYSPENVNEVTKMWDVVQRGFNCCGVNSYKDWLNNEDASKKLVGLPLSCCDVPYGLVDTFNCNEKTSTLHNTGCKSAFGEFIQNHAYTLGAVGMGFAVIQFLGILFSCHLAKQLKYYDNF